MLRVGSLFSGIGGLELGLERAGMKTIWQVEQDEYCRRVLRLRFPDAVPHRDVRYVRGPELDPIDLLCGGFPCQPVSLAGKRLAQDDERWLWPHFIRLVRALEPRWVVAENVRGLLSKGIEEVLADLAQSGYDAEWGLLPAAAMGAPHVRNRVFIVAYPDHLRRDVGSGRRPGRRGEPANDGPLVSDPDGQRFQEPRSPLAVVEEPAGVECDRPRVFGGNPGEPDPWLPEPNLRRVAHGVPHRVDRVRALGNAVVPQVAQWIGERIVAWEARHGIA